MRQPCHHIAQAYAKLGHHASDPTPIHLGEQDVTLFMVHAIPISPQAGGR